MLETINVLERLKTLCEHHIGIADTILILSQNYSEKKEFLIKRECYNDIKNFCNNELIKQYQVLDDMAKENENNER